MAAQLGDARPGHVDHHLSTAFQQIARFAFEVRFEKSQRAVGIIVQQDADQFNEVVVFDDEADRFLQRATPHPVAGASMTMACSAASFSACCGSVNGGQSASFFCDATNLIANE